jgi:hypothetical protein
VSRTTVTLDGILDGLKATPARIAEIVSGRPPAHLNTAPEPDGWSANAVLAHLRACADQWGGCFERILAEDRPTLRAISPRAWIRSTDYLELDFGPSVSAYTAQRAELL